MADFLSKGQSLLSEDSSSSNIGGSSRGFEDYSH